jgi:hypothetical protein
MDRKFAENLLEHLAILTITIEDISRKIPVENRKLVARDLGTLLKSCIEMQMDIGNRVPDLHPMYLGLGNFSKLRKKHENPEYPVEIPTEEEIKKAEEQWLKIRKVTRNKHAT